MIGGNEPAKIILTAWIPFILILNTVVPPTKQLPTNNEHQSTIACTIIPAHIFLHLTKITANKGTTNLQSKPVKTGI